MGEIDRKPGGRLSECVKAFGVGRSLFLSPKEVPPPTPDGREGRLFPPEQSWKTLRLLNELAAGGNKILHELFRGTTVVAKKIIAAPGADGLLLQRNEAVDIGSASRRNRASQKSETSDPQ